MSDGAEAVMEVYAAELCSESECDTATVSEVDDVVQGSEPGASRFSMLISTDSYDDVAKFADSSYSDTNYAGRLLSSPETTEQAKDNTDSVNSERTVADGGDSRLQNERLKPPEPIFARIDTPTSLSEDDLLQRRLTSAPAFSSQTHDDAQQITVRIFFTVFMLALFVFLLAYFYCSCG